MKARASARAALHVAACVALAAAPVAASATGEYDRLARDIFKELIEIDTTDERGDNTRAAEAMAARLRAAGFGAEEVKVVAPAPKKGNLVARLRGAGARKPLLLLAHLDVVEARKEDWSVDPFTFLERDGYYYGRGTTDDKAMAAIWITNLIRLKREGFGPDRDIVVALTADEEGGSYNGVEWLLKEHRDLVDAEYALNEGGGGQSRGGKYLANRVQASEKVYLSFRLEATNPGGHSSQPTKDNAIYRLASSLARLSRFDFPVQLNEVTRAFFDRMAGVEAGPLGAAMRGVLQTPPDAQSVARLSESPFYNAQMRTTCVATRLEGGHADNALAQVARAVVNCRILPGQPAGEVHQTIVSVLADKKISVTPIDEPKPSEASPLRPDVMGPIQRITQAMWPGVPVVPVMGTGATDSLYLRQAGIQAYGVSGLFGEVDDNRAHGRDERIGVRQFHEGQEFLYRLVKTLAAAPATR